MIDRIADILATRGDTDSKDHRWPRHLPRRGLGPITLTMLSHFVGHTRITAVPVIRPYDSYGVEHYEIPAGLRERIALRDTMEIFPFSNRTARTSQLDHTIPYAQNGPPNQTRAANLGPLTTKAHRAKTHGDRYQRALDHYLWEHDHKPGTTDP